MGKIFGSVDELIGNTPMIELKNIEKKFGLQARLVAKVECFNPAGSVKDRVAKAMIDAAEKSGALKKGSVIIEPTSGNTGIGLASVASARGYRTIIVMPSTMSVERKLIMRAYGAEVVLTDGKLGMQGAIDKAQQLAQEIENSFIPNQFDNPVNADAHFQTTGHEIWQDCDGKVDFFVAGVGTGGTITGVGEYLKSVNPFAQIVAVEPLSSAFLSTGKAGAHKIQGLGAGFVPKVLNVKIFDQIVAVSDEDAFKFGRLMGKTEGLLVGISSGAALKAAVDIAKKKENFGKTVVVLFPDNGERYLSSEMYQEE